MVKTMLLEVSGNGEYNIFSTFTFENKIAVVYFTVDTGADITCCPASAIAISEDYCIAREFPTVMKQGIVKDKTVASVKFYKVPVENFCLAETIKINNQNIYITFDTRYTSILLGRDITNQLYYYHAIESQILFLTDKYSDLLTAVKKYQ